MELPFELSFGLFAGQMYWQWCEFIGNLLGVEVGRVGEPDALFGELCGCLPLRPLTSRHRCDMPVR